MVRNFGEVKVNKKFLNNFIKLFNTDDRQIRLIFIV